MCRVLSKCARAVAIQKKTLRVLFGRISLYATYTELRIVCVSFFVVVTSVSGYSRACSSVCISGLVEYKQLGCKSVNMQTDDCAVNIHLERIHLFDILKGQQKQIVVQTNCAHIQNLE